MKASRVVAAMMTLLAVFTVMSAAQSDNLAGRFPAVTETALRTLIDSARAEGLPTEPLVQRALEGVSRGAEPSRVLLAVRGLLGRLSVARTTLGASATEAELVAAASTLYLGVTPDTLAQLRKRHARSSLALPLVVLADMIQQGVPRSDAAGIILSLSDAGIADESYRSLRQAVLLDIRSGVPPATAAAMRARGALLAQPAGASRPRSPSAPPQ
jgi:hypothetical protein